MAHAGDGKMIRITLLRHGKPQFELAGFVCGKDLGRIAASYDLSGIAGVPPAETVTAVQGRHLVVCSHLLRSVESAKALGFDEIHVKDALFGETALPHFRGGTLALPVSAWIVLLRFLWLFGFSRNGESLADARKRAKHAAKRLIELAEEHRSVLLVGHGFINCLIARELRACGWLGPAKPNRKFWGLGIYERTIS